MFYVTDYKITNIDLWNEEETKQTNYTIINFDFDGWKVSFNNETSKPESIAKIPAVLQEMPKEYKLNTNNKEACFYLNAAINLYNNYQEV